MTRLTQSAFAALARKHFGFLSEDEPVLDYRLGAFFATYASSPRTVVLECWEDADFLEAALVERSGGPVLSAAPELEVSPR